MRSLPGNDLEPSINNRHKQEFRLLAQHKALAIEILEKYDGQVITRAWLIGAIQDALFVKCSAVAGSEWRRRTGM
jgi:hypothetical protein